MFLKRSLTRIGRLIAIFAIAISLLLVTAVPPGMAQDLPLPDPEFHGTITDTYVNSEADETLLMPVAQPPEGAPNVVLVMLDDVGFGASETFGGPVHTPTLNELADDGLRYNRFHTTAMCSPTRAGLLTGRNHHSASSGIVTNFATGFPGYSGRIPQSTATVAKILQGNGYNTAWFGKNHNLPLNESTSVGPFTHWPNELGFDYFYGFNDDSGETDQWYPSLYENHIPINQPSYPDEEDLDNSYNLTRDLADRAISWMKHNHSLSPDTPFFLYFAPGATHTPHQPPPSYTKKYEAGGEHAIAAGAEETGMFVEGWDQLQKKICDNQEAMGIIPEGTQCTARPDEIPPWIPEEGQEDIFTDEYRSLMTKQMQTFAGFLEYTDEQVGRVIHTINDLGEKDNTLIIYIVGDNGGSAEGSYYGACNVWATYTNNDYTMEENLDCLDEWGNPGTAPHYSIGWTWATNAPFRWTKQVASHFGGTRNPMVISWPDGIEDDAKGELREQFLHVIDVAPTILDVVGIDPPSQVNDTWQKPMEGASFANTFKSDGENATPLRDTQYFEVLAHRGIYHDGWMASSFNQAPWIDNPSKLFFKGLEDNWELFNLNEDFSQAEDLRPQVEDSQNDYECPDDLETLDNKESDLYYFCKAEEMIALFDSEAKEHNVYPLDDRFNGRAIMKRPSVLGDRTEFEFYPESIFLPGAVAPNFAITDYIITADLNITDPDNVQGVILANGGDASGFSLYVNQDHHLVFEYNYFNLDRTQIVSQETLPEGQTSVAFFFDYDGQIGGTGSLYVRHHKVDSQTYVNDEEVTEDKIEKTLLGTFTDSFDVGMDMRGPVSEDYEAELPFEFTGGEIKKVNINIDPSEHDIQCLERPICESSDS
jgi:arylsulfatase